MSGWLAIRNSQEPLEKTVERFRAVFQVSQLPLVHQHHPINPQDHFIQWMWQSQPDWADLHQWSVSFGEMHFILDGYITGLGKYGIPTKEQPVLQQIGKLWQAHGTAIIPELNGSFSLTILEKQKTHVVTDRWCSRPVWYAQHQQTLFLGNFNAAIAAIFPQSLSLDPASMWALLATNRPIAAHSIHQEIKRIGAGCHAVFEDSQLPNITKWFNLRYQPDHSRSVRSWGKELAARLQDVARNLDNLFPNKYLFLSGGMDSRVAAAAFKGHINSITLTTHANMNSKMAERVAKAIGAQHQTIFRDDHWYLERMEATALIAGGNYQVHHAHFMKALEQVNATGGATFLLGDLMENFNKHYYKPSDEEIASLTPQQVPAIFHRLFSYSHKDWGHYKSLFQSDFVSEMMQNWVENMSNLTQNCFNVSEDRRDAIDALFRWYDNCFCPTNLMLECIKPFASHANLMFDIALFDLFISIPADIKGKGVLHREILRQLDSSLLWIPNSNFWLPPVVPKGVEQMTRKVRPLLGKARRSILRKRQKTKGPVVKTEGSWHMMHEWYRHDPKHRDLIASVLTDKQALPEEMFQHKAIQTSWQAFQAGDLSKSFELYSLLSFGLLNRQLR